MISHFFIDRPIFAAVLSIVIVLVGGVAAVELPIAQYPEVAPPTVNVTATYPGANAKTVAETVATPIEVQVNGVERMLYMSSRCTNDGQMTMDVTFELGTNLDQAQVFVQNRVAIAEASLPDEVKRQGVTTKKKSPSILLCVNLISPGGRYDQLYLSNFATINIKDELARIKGVGDVTFLGPRDYSMRVWLDPNKLAARELTASDVIKAIKEQNVQVAAGRLGQPPLPGKVPFQLVINTQGRLESEEKFGKILVKTGSQGQPVYLRDLVRDTIVGLNLDSAKLAARKITPEEIASALKGACRRVEFKPFDASPRPANKKLQLQLTQPPPQNIGDFAIKVDAGKQKIALKDLVRDDDGIVEKQAGFGKGVELGAKAYDVNSYLDGEPAVTMAVFQLPGSNALETAKAIKEKMDELKTKFPKGVEYQIYYDTTVFINESIHEVYKTLIEAIILVFVVVLVFLQNWRATIIPMIAVPVSLVGTLAVMAMLGFSLNNLSLFGLVLAIGIVVDDAIVVVENVERWMAMGLGPREASRKAMEEVTGPVVGIALVLCAVFVPTAFMAGISGQFFRQFGLTIAASTVISCFNSLTLSPALCALLLKPHGHGEHGPEHREALPRLGIALIGGLVAFFLLTPYAADILGIHLPASGHGAPAEHETAPSSSAAIAGLRAAVFLAGFVIGWLLAGIVNRFLGAFFQGFNWVFDRTINGYGFIVGMFLRLSVIMLVIYGGLIGLTVLGFKTVAVGFIPEQDKGYLVVNAQLPEGASLDRSDTLIAEMTKIARGDKNDPERYPGIDGVDHVISVPGYSILLSTNISNVGGMFVILKPFEERKGKAGLSGPEIAAELRKKYSELQQARITVFSAPAIDGLGTAGGFKLQVQDRRGAGLRALEGAVQEVAGEGNQDKRLVGLFSSFSTNQPQIYVDIDREKAKRMHVSLDDINQTLQAYLGSAYVNDITLFNRNWQVYVQADARNRLRVEDIGKLETRNAEGARVPLRTLITVNDTSGPAIVNHYNLFPSAEINGNTAPGVSSGQAITIMDKLCADYLPQTMGKEWTELTYQQLLAAKDLLTKLVFPLAVVFVFLTLSAMYESWSLPLAIILIVPMCLLAAITGVLLSRLDNNIFTQIGLVVLVGLAAKNAILIVEFAKQLQDQGKSAYDATVEACRLRLRPILMTSFAFILGVVPLVLAKGAGAEMRVALGIAVFSGMLGVTIFGIFFTPVFYVVIRWFSGQGKAAEGPGAGKAAAADAATGDGLHTAASTAITSAERPAHE
jgi:multidrug efflux pump